MNIKALNEKRNEIYAEMEAVVQAAVTETRSMTTEETEAYERKKAELEEIDRTIEAAEATRRAKRDREKKDPEGGKITTEERSFVNFVRGVVENRADTNTTNSNSGAVVPTSVANKIIEHARNVSPILEYSTIYNTKGSLTIPYEDSTSTISATYVEDHSTADATAQKLLSITLSGYTIRAIAKVGRALLDSTDFDLLNYIVKKVGEALAYKIEQEFLVGTTNKIAGIAGGVTAKVTAASSTALTADELIDVQDKVPDVYQHNAIWIMHPDTRTALRKLKDSEGRYILNSDATTKWGYTLFGKPVYASDSMPKMAASALAVYYGDMSGLAAKIEEIDVVVSRERYVEQHAIGIFGFANVDAKIENAQKISAIAMKAGS